MHKIPAKSPSHHARKRRLSVFDSPPSLTKMASRLQPRSKATIVQEKVLTTGSEFGYVK